VNAITDMTVPFAVAITTGAPLIITGRAADARRAKVSP
jgi:hypothetical protein